MSHGVQRNTSRIAANTVVTSDIIAFRASGDIPSTLLFTIVALSLLTELGEVHVLLTGVHCVFV